MFPRHSFREAPGCAHTGPPPSDIGSHVDVKGSGEKERQPKVLKSSGNLSGVRSSIPGGCNKGSQDFRGELY